MLNFISSRIQNKLDYAYRCRDTANNMLVERGEYLTMLSLDTLEPASQNRDSRADYLVDMIEIVDESLENMVAEMKWEMRPEELADLWTDRCEIDFCRGALMRETMASLTRDSQALRDLRRQIEDLENPE